MNVYTVFCRFIPTLKWDLLKKFCHSDEGGSTFPRNVGTIRDMSSTWILCRLEW